MASGDAGDSHAMASGGVGAGGAGDSWEYNLRKYLLLLATLVATITYTAGFNPPGGVWQDTDDAAGHFAGDPIIRDTSYRRYLAFFYTNATAFASSLVVIVLILILAVLQEKKKAGLAPLVSLRIVMVLDLFSLMAAYAAGTCRDMLTAVYSSALTLLVVVYVFVQMIWAAPTKSNQKAERQERSKDRQKQRKMLMLLATFAASVTYLAGLSVPGGFWDNSEGGHRPGVAVLKGRHDARLKTFFVFNTTAFMASLLIIVLLLDKKLRLSNQSLIIIVPEQQKKRIPCRLYAIIILALIGLIGAYSAGSCREIDTSIYVNALVGAVLGCIGLQVLIVNYFGERISSIWKQLVGRFRNSVTNWLPQIQSPRSRKGNSSNDQGTHALEKARSLVLLLASLAATITYQAGLDPPGGLWEDDGDGYMAGDPILLTTNPRRYKAFFYCNSVAFVASLVAIILVRYDALHKHNSLEAAMILDLFGLIGAYAAGSCRDVTTSIYAMALAGAVLVYVVIHVAFFTLDHEDNDEKAKEDNAAVDKRRKRLLLFAILAATITYQAGLTPPSGFRLKDDKSGHHAGDPVLYYNFPRRYNAFFYCNSVSFMLSIALIILLVNKNLYRPAIRSNALSVCTAAGMFSLIGAYAAGSTQSLKTSIYIFALAAIVLIFVAGLVVVLCLINKKSGQQVEPQTQSGSGTADEESGRRKETGTEQLSAPKNPEIKASDEKAAPDSQADAKNKSHAKRKYLMLLGILVASVTYQAGLEPPGGFWQSDGVGHAAGNPVMHDNRRARYRAFFYSNTTSFVASVVVIILLLLESLHQKEELPLESLHQKKEELPLESLHQKKEELPLESLHQKKEELWPFRVMNTTVALDLLGLLVAYAVGSSRSWKTTGYVLALVIAVLAYIGVHVMLSRIIRKSKNTDERKDGGASAGESLRAVNSY